MHSDSRIMLDRCHVAAYRAMRAEAAPLLLQGGQHAPSVATDRCDRCRC